MSHQKVDETNFFKTMSKSAEETFSQAGEKYRSIFENAVEGIYQSTPDGKFITVNSAMSRLLGYESPEDLLANLINIEQQYYVLPDCWGEFNRLIESQGFVRHFESQVYCKDGNTIWISTNARAVRDTHGMLLYYEGFVTDITERKRAQEALKESEEKYRLLVQNSNDAIFIAQDGVIKFPNLKAEELLGYSAIDLARIPFANHIHPDDREMVLEKHKKRLDGEEFPSTYPFRILDKWGEELWLEINAVFILWEGRPATLNIVRNITEKKQAEKELKRTKKGFQNLVENINEVVFRLDNQGRFEYLSPVIEQKLSYKVEEMLGRPLAWFVHPEDLPDFLDSMKHSLLGKQESFEFRVLEKNGQVRHMSISGQRFIKGGQPIGLTGVLSDITERKWSEVLLTRAENNFRSIFENALEGIYQSTIDGQFIVANPACARILGYASPEELITQGSSCEPPFYVSPELRQKFLDQLEEDGIVKGFEHQVLRKDGSKIWVSEKALAIRDNDGHVLFYEGTIEDITERKRAEEQIRFLSFHDKLTGLYNRAYFVEEMRGLNTQRQLPISIIMGDVNGLKLLNDAFGHQEGDKLLLKIATILQECCREEDVVARLGGDEFAIFLPKTGHQETMEITDRIKAACRKNSQGILELNIALGAVTKEDLSQDIEFLLKEAEDRMYRNKLLESKSVRSSIMSSLRRTLFEKSYETEEHTSRSKDLAIQIAEALRLPASLLDELALLANLHDIGKIAIPEEIILKPGHLSPEEWGLISKHPEIGYRIANSSTEMAPIAEAILAHHEWWNGAGYPRRLSGERIPLISRIIAAVDAYDVMVHGRLYKGAVTKHDALSELWRHAGSQFDPLIVEIFIKFFSRIKIKKFF